MKDRAKIRSLIDTKEKVNIELAIEMSKSIGQYIWIQEDYLNLFDQLIKYLWLNPKEIEISRNEINDVEKIHYLQNLTRLRIYDAPTRKLSYQIRKVLSAKELILKQVKPINIPNFIFQFRSLEFIYLGDLGLNEIRKEIGGLTNLKEINMEGNLLEDLPWEISKLKNLTNIDLLRNQLKKVPEVLYTMKNLKTISLAYNNIPDEEIEQLKVSLPSCYIFDNKEIDDLPF